MRKTLIDDLDETAGTSDTLKLVVEEMSRERGDMRIFELIFREFKKYGRHKIRAPEWLRVHLRC